MSNNSFSLKFTDKSSHQKALSHLFRLSDVITSDHSFKYMCEHSPDTLRMH